MKIIGTSAAGYIAELGDDDLAALLGESWLGSSDAKTKLDALKVPRVRDHGMTLVGATINLKGRFARVLEVERHYAALGEKAAQFRLLATAIDGLAAEPLTPPPPASSNEPS